MNGHSTGARGRFRALLMALGVVMAAALMVVLLPAPPASAHASLVSQAPDPGELLQEAPQKVELTFSEGVSLTLGGFRLFGPDGKPLDLAKPSKSRDGLKVSVPFDGTAQGTYTVAWRVLSADGHPISSAFTFSVGKDTSGGAPGRGQITGAFAGAGGDRTVGVSFGVARFLAFAGLSVLVGGFAFIWLVWPSGRRSPAARLLLRGAWAATFVATVAGILLQGPYAGGLGLGDAFDGALIGDVLGTRFGTVWALRLGLLVVGLAWLRGIRPLAPGTDDDGPVLPPPAARAAAGIVGGALLLTPGLAGHATTGQYVGLALPADLAHLGGVAFWLGGLAMLCAAVLPARDEPLGHVVPRFSRMAFWSVIVIIVTGSFQSWRQVRFLDALTDTTYGRALLVKLVAFVGLIGLAAVSRRVVHQKLRLPAGAVRRPRLAGPGAMLADPDDMSRSQLRRTVLAEVVIAVVVLSATSILVNSVPGREAEAAGGTKPFSTTLVSDAVDLELAIEPAAVGHNQFHIYTLDKEGAALGVEELTATLALPAQELGPLPLKLTKIYDGHWQADQQIALPGSWELVFTARLDEFNQERLVAEFVVPASS